MDAIGMAKILRTEGYHGKGAITDCLELCGMGSILSGSNVEFKYDTQEIADSVNKCSF